METKRKTRTYVIQSDGIIAKIKYVNNKGVYLIYNLIIKATS